MIRKIKHSNLNRTKETYEVGEKKGKERETDSLLAAKAQAHRNS